MELRVYGSDLMLKGIVENHISLLWSRRYNEVGSFEGHFPITDTTSSVLKLGNLITFLGAGDAGVIENIRIEESPDTKEIYVSGRFLPAYLDRRLIRGTMNFNGKTEVAMRQIITNMTSIPKLTLGTLNNFTETVEFQATYKNVLTYIQKLSLASAIGFRMRPDFTAKKIYFETYKGTDHSSSQATNSRVEFSDRYSNIEKTDYTENDQLYKNVAYVGGEGEGSERVYVTVGQTSSTGLNRREVFVDARDLRSEDLTASQYQNVLKQRGRDKLAEYVNARYLECEVVPNGNFLYRTDYDVGDIVTIKRGRFGISEDMRITCIREVYQHGNVNIEPTFGTALPQRIDWSDN